jgi:phage terminase Nu1 subunit (DNA packaging protein)
MVLNQSEIAEAFGVTTRAIQKWHNEGMPLEGMDGKENQYDLTKCVEWYVKRRVGNDLQYEKTRLTKAQANKTELEGKLLERELLRADNVKNVWVSQIIAFRSRVLAMPTKLAPDILQATSLTEAKGIIADALEEALKEFKDVPLDAYA